MRLKASQVDSVIQEYGVNVDATRPIKLRKAHLPKDTRIYGVQDSSLDAYIIDTPMTQRIACHAHVVGEDLERLALEAAQQSLPAILELSQNDTPRTMVRSSSNRFVECVLAQPSLQTLVC